MNEKICFVKPVRKMGVNPQLDVNRLINNNNNEIETSIIVDTNLLCIFENIIKKGNKWRHVREYKLEKLVTLLNQPNTAISISAGTAYFEMPPANRKFSHYCYNEFLRVHAKHLSNDPRGSNKKPRKSKITSWGFNDLDTDAKSLLSFVYGSFLVLQLVNRESLNPVKKYSLYMQRTIKELDLMITSLSEIAKICFYNPSKQLSKEFKYFVAANKDNFLKTTKTYYGKKLSTADGIKQSAFNSTLDLFICMTAMYSDTNGLEGSNQDTWIATTDKKLVAFIEYFGHLYTGESTGLFAILKKYPEQEVEIYWNSVDNIFSQISQDREEKLFRQNIDTKKPLAAIQQLHTEIETKYSH